MSRIFEKDNFKIFHLYSHDIGQKLTFCRLQWLWKKYTYLKSKNMTCPGVRKNAVSFEWFKITLFCLRIIKSNNISSIFSEASVALR